MTSCLVVNFVIYTHPVKFKINNMAVFSDVA